MFSASIISKKAAENLSALVLDVKFGKGALLKSYQAAKELATTLVSYLLIWSLDYHVPADL